MTPADLAPFGSQQAAQHTRTPGQPRIIGGPESNVASRFDVSVGNGRGA